MPEGPQEGGYTKQIGSERLGPTLVIAASMILAIRTARMMKPEGDPLLANRGLDEEVDRALKLAQKVLTQPPRCGPTKDVPWYVPDGTDEML